MLDFNNPDAYGIAADRINALNSAASLVLTGSSLGNSPQRDSIIINLLDIAAELAEQIADAAARAELMGISQEASHHA